MAESNFIVKNGLVVNTSFTANSTALQANGLTVNSTVATFSGNVTIGSTLTSANLIISNLATVGSNIQLSTTSLVLGNSTVNSTHTSSVVSLSRNVGDNTSAIEISTTGSGYAYLELGGSSGSYIDFKAPYSDDYDQRIQTSSSSIEIIGGSSTSAANNILLLSANVGIGTITPDARLAVSGTANVSGNVVIGGITTHNANVILGSSGLSANGGFGTAGQLLNSNGTATYWASDKATNAYTNAVAYVDGKAYVNTSQLSSNLANYALLTGATFSGNVRTQQSAQVDGNLVVSGNLAVSGNVIVVGANNLSVVDNMIYLNSNSTVSNPDLGFAGNYNDGVYRHTGFFRDASDGIWKVFDSYLPEPDASPYIDTTNSSFHIANFQANVVYVGNTTVYSTVNTTSFSGTANNATYLNGQLASFYTNATNITTGTLDTARLPATANISTAVNVGANVNLTTTTITVGNSTVNTVITQTEVDLPYSLLGSATLVTSTTTANQILDQFAFANFKATEYYVYVSSGSAFQSCKIAVLTDGTTAYSTEYGTLTTGSSLASFDVTVSGANVVLRTTPVNAVTTYKLFKNLINV